MSQSPDALARGWGRRAGGPPSSVLTVSTFSLIRLMGKLGFPSQWVHGIIRGNFPPSLAPARKFALPWGAP